MDYKRSKKTVEDLILGGGMYVFCFNRINFGISSAV